MQQLLSCLVFQLSLQGMNKSDHALMARLHALLGLYSKLPYQPQRCSLSVLAVRLFDRLQLNSMCEEVEVGMHNLEQHLVMQWLPRSYQQGLPAERVHCC